MTATLAPGADRRRPEDVPPLPPRLQLVRAVLVLVLVASVSILLQLMFVSRLQHDSAQRRAFDAYRSKLANGTAPIGPTDDLNVELPLGAGVAYLEIPAIDLAEVVLEGTTSPVLFDGPGHRRDTPLPGQVGTSVLMGRRAAYGGSFGDLGDLRKGDEITVTTGQGVFTYVVTGARRDGDVLPPALPRNGSRLTLVTAAGSPFMPDGVYSVDAELDGQATGGPARLYTADSLPLDERVMSGDAGTLWALALWLQGLILLSVGAAWSWNRWSRAASWIVFFPPLLLVGLAAAGEVARLLPNLL